MDKNIDKEELARKLGQNLIEVLSRKDMTQVQLAKKVGISISSMNRYAQGACLPTVEVAVKIADELGVSLDMMLGRSASGSNGEWKIIRGSIMCSKCGTIINDTQTWKYVFCPRCGRRNRG